MRNRGESYKTNVLDGSLLIKNSIIDSTDLFKNSILDSGNLFQDKLINFSSTMLVNLKNAGNLIESDFKEQLAPLGDGLKTIFDSLISNLMQQQVQQDNGLMSYLPFGMAGIGLLIILNKK